MAKKTGQSKGGNKNNKRNNNNRGNNSRGYNPNQNRRPVQDIKAIEYTDGITVSELADKIGRQSSEIIKTLFMEGQMVTINSALDDETVQLICIGYDIDATKVKEREEDSLEIDEVSDPEKLVEQVPAST